MKKLICVVLSVGLALSLSFSCFAEVNPDAYWYPLEDGSYGYDSVAYRHDCAVDMVQGSGVDIDPELYWYIDEDTGTYAYDYDSFMVDYSAAVAARSVVESPAVVEPPLSVDVPVADESTEEVIDDSLEDDVVSDVLEDSESVDGTVLGYDRPMVYSVNDLRSSNVSAAAVSDSALTAFEIWGYGTHRIDYPVGDSFSIYWSGVDGVLEFWEGNGTDINHEINLDKQYIFLSDFGLYIDKHWNFYDSVPVNADGDSFTSIWGENVHNLTSQPIYPKLEQTQGDLGVSELTIYPDGTYTAKSNPIVFLAQKAPIEIDLQKRLLYFPELELWMNEHYKLYDTEPVVSEPVPPEDDAIVNGLKAIIVSIFGEYTPVYTTMAITETVDNVTTTTLVDAVASGSAGVDYEWLAGVLLFGIMLYCLFKLLGGIMS